MEDSEDEDEDEDGGGCRCGAGVQKDDDAKFAAMPPTDGDLPRVGPPPPAFTEDDGGPDQTPDVRRSPPDGNEDADRDPDPDPDPDDEDDVDTDAKDDEEADDGV